MQQAEAGVTIASGAQATGKIDKISGQTRRGILAAGAIAAALLSGGAMSAAPTHPNPFWMKMEKQRDIKRRWRADPDEKNDIDWADIHEEAMIASLLEPAEDLSQIRAKAHMLLDDFVLEDCRHEHRGGHALQILIDDIDRLMVRA